MGVHDISWYSYRLVPVQDGTYNSIFGQDDCVLIFWKIDNRAASSKALVVGVSPCSSEAA